VGGPKRSVRSYGIESRICSWMGARSGSPGGCARGATPCAAMTFRPRAGRCSSSRPASALRAMAACQLAESLRIAGLELLVGVEPEDPAAVAASRPTLRASEKLPVHGEVDDARAEDSAISTERSLEPVSTMMISETAERHDSRQAASISSSSRTIMQREMRPASGRVRTRAARRSMFGRRLRSVSASGERRACARDCASGGAPRRVAAHVLGVRIEPEHALEQLHGERRLVEPVDGHPEVVQEDGLMRLAPEPGHRQLDDGDRRAHPAIGPEPLRSSSNRSHAARSIR